jgi:hypothetical protein
METIELSGIALLGITLLDSGNKYKAGSKLEGQTFSRFVYNNKVFTVNDKSEFIADFKAGAVKSLTLTPSTMQVLDADGKPTTEVNNTIQFASHITNAQWSAYRKAQRAEAIDEAMFDGKLSTIRSLDFSKVDKALLDLLEVEA